ncbi:hypothetical protein PQU96_10735 [Vogesella sp. LYT5W]|uniref:Uncharacterized protein n=1 Tax=Vogesella margarita TaxID=2984199 RepID=A0ABT5IPV3_9NEIS|nr:hypothetical protein [Vogesella margarita]MDC7714594.1 hypothetical protein [Vogesella margarita]
MRLTRFLRPLAQPFDMVRRLYFLSQRPSSYADIDPGIAPLVEQFAQIPSVQTLASCQGHPTRHRSPYISFSSTVEIAEAIDARVQGALSQNQLNYYWSIMGVFNQDSRLTFLLYSPELKVLARGTWSAFYHLGLCRQAVEQDIETIGQLIAGKNCVSLPGARH